MCGIAGIVDASDAHRQQTLQRMLDRIVHRGPDDVGQYVNADHALALGTRRLSIIDIEGGAQPIWNEDNSICIVFNGEIYNYLELRRGLTQQGHRFRTASDTEVLVHLYESVGDKMVKHLRGMFAFCIFDRHQNRLFLARDHFGQKPLYYTVRDGRFAFASELKSLLALHWVVRDIDDDSFLDFAAWLSLPAPRTHFRHIKKLPAGTTLSIDLTGAEPKLHRYWNYDLGIEPDLTDAATAIVALDQALEESVELHLHADVPVGVLLSSGLDSRTLLTYATTKNGGALHTFSVGFGTHDSELKGAAETARELGSHHHSLLLGPGDLSETMDRVIALLDEPIGDPACFAVLRLCEMAHDHVKVLLSGEGSDELFAGYEQRYAGMLTTMARTRWIRRLSPLLFGNGLCAGPSRWNRAVSRGKQSKAAEVAMLRIEGFPGDTRAPQAFSTHQLRLLPVRAGAIASETFEPQRDGLSELLAFDLRWQLAESLLQKADKMSMGASMELRTPFLDVEVAQVAARISSELKLPSGGPGKYILRAALSRKVNEPLGRPKRGFPVPLHSWLSGPLRDQVESDLFAAGSVVCTLLDRCLLRNAWNDLMRGRDNSRAIFALWLYERWRSSMER